MKSYMMELDKWLCRQNVYTVSNEWAI